MCKALEIDLSFMERHPVILKGHDYNAEPMGRMEVKDGKLFLIPFGKKNGELLAEGLPNLNLSFTLKDDGVFEVIGLHFM